MGDIDIDRARALCDAATPGPWLAWNRGVGYEVHAHLGGDGGRYEVFGYVHDDCATLADAEFVAKARTLVPALLDALAAAEARTRELEATVQRVKGLHEPTPLYPEATPQCLADGHATATEDDGTVVCHCAPPLGDCCAVCAEPFPCSTVVALRGSDV